jgi:Terpene cyclase DEP1
MRMLLLTLILAAFGAYSVYVMWDFGYLGIWRAGFANAAALQILLDLVITCLLISAWMVADARARGLTAWPFVGITVAAGSFGPLLYLLYRERRAPG